MRSARRVHPWVHRLRPSAGPYGGSARRSKRRPCECPLFVMSYAKQGWLCPIIIPPRSCDILKMVHPRVHPTARSALLEPGNATDPSGMQLAEGLFQGLYMAKVEANGGPRVETQVREQAVRDIPVYVAAGAVTGCALGGCAVVAEAATLRTTVHGAARIAGAAATRGGILSRFEVAVTRTFGQRMVQADGASVSVLKTAGGRFNVVVRNNETGRVVTTLKGISQKSFDRLARRYGYQ
jgi:hypothetical protein